MFHINVFAYLWGGIGWPCQCPPSFILLALLIVMSYFLKLTNPLFPAPTTSSSAADSATRSFPGPECIQSFPWPHQCWTAGRVSTVWPLNMSLSGRFSSTKDLPPENIRPNRIFANWWKVWSSYYERTARNQALTREMEQPATLPLRFPSSPIDLAPSALEWKGYNRSHLDRAAIFKTRPTSSAVREPLTFSKPLISKRPKQQRRKVDTNRQQSKGNSLSSLVAGSSALLGALAVSLLTPGAFPESSPGKT